MPNTDKRIGAYISQSADFAKPILNHFRSLVHKTCPEVEETMKWSFPHFDYKGMMCSMAAFKQHCAFNFWKAALLKDGKKLLENREEAMGSFGRITSLKDLPSDKIIIGYIKEAMLLNEKNLKVQKPKVANNKELMVTQYLSDSFKKNKKALSTFENFSTSNKKEYINWITEAKTEETRKKRLAQAVEWMEEGKIKNWKYIK
jgi:uncharacterized protein YdeI (YjbR/CyaY-like superfamily)